MTDPWDPWTPSTGDVGAWIRARLIDRDGSVTDDFTAGTRPTASQVTSLIVDAVADVYGQVGDVPPVLYPQARRVASLGAALIVELSYYPEQTTSGRSNYDRLKVVYDDSLKRLGHTVGEAQQGQDILGDAMALPEYGFDPVPEGGASYAGADYPYSGPRRPFPGTDTTNPLGMGTVW